MPGLNIFDNDAFSLSSLTKAINDQPHVPGRIGALGLFAEEGISTLTVQVERQGEALSLVPAGQRGAPAPHVTGDKRSMVDFRCLHLPQRATIGADEVQGVRQFGTDSELETVQSVVNKRLAKMRRRLDATIEFQRIGAIKGLILDADGATPLLDIFERFGLVQQALSMALSDQATELRSKCSEMLDLIETSLGNLSFNGAHVLCGKEFWRKLIVHKAIKETYLNTQMAASLRGDPHESFDFGGCVWERYRGSVGGQAFVGENEAYAVPDGVADLFVTHYGPADYMETVNTIGLPYYAKQELLQMDKGVLIEAQSNPISLCTRPRSVIKLTA